MSTIKNVAIYGAAGSLGEHVLKALIDSKKFNISILTRPTSKSTFPSSVKVIKVDISSLSDLTSALKGQDAVVSTVGSMGALSQITLIDAAVVAGVKRFLPSEFGCDLDDPPTSKLPVFGYKIQVLNYIKEQAAKHPEFTYTLIRNNAFLDWGLDHDFIFQPKSANPRIFDGGGRPFTVTSLPTVAKSVVGALSKPEETKNRAVFIQDMVTTQERMLAIAKKLAPERKWEPKHETIDAVHKAADEQMAKGNMGAILEYLYPACMGDRYHNVFEQNDNELLGIKGDKTDKDIEAIMKPLLVK